MLVLLFVILQGSCIFSWLLLAYICLWLKLNAVSVVVCIWLWLNPKAFKFEFKSLSVSFLYQIFDNSICLQKFILVNVVNTLFESLISKLAQFLIAQDHLRDFNFLMQLFFLKSQFLADRFLQFKLPLNVFFVILESLLQSLVLFQQSLFLVKVDKPNLFKLSFTACFDRHKCAFHLLHFELLLSHLHRQLFGFAGLLFKHRVQVVVLWLSDLLSDNVSFNFFPKPLDLHLVFFCVLGISFAAYSFAFKFSKVRMSRSVFILFAQPRLNKS